VFLTFASLGFSQTANSSNAASTAKLASPDLTKQSTLYVIPYAHLDTQWRWDYARTIGEFLPKTLRDNFDLLDRYPHYVFNFSGANRYRMMKEYYPADYARMKQYIAAGRWFPSGSSMEENDVNSPSAESIIRQILYGKQYFRREFGKTSAEFMLPDCFGFPASLPSILAHVGLKGFSTQKLSWKGAAPVGGPDSPEKTPAGIPFNVGFWEGPDGKGVIAALNAMTYSGDVTYDISKSPVTDPSARNNPTDWVKRIQINGQASGLFADYHYYGTGDTGGSPREPSIKLMEAILAKGTTVLPAPRNRGQVQTDQPTTPIQVGDGPVNIVQTTAEQMFLDIKPEQTARLPRYKGDLELIEHSAGSLTSQTYLKRWNRQNEVLADSAERASVAAAWLGGRTYPQQRLYDAWTLVMGGQFHDIIPGTSIPKAYEYSWNDELLAMNQFAGVLTSATESIASGLNIEAKGTPVVVFNGLSIPRQDVIEAAVSFPGGIPKAVRVVGPDGKEVPSQLSGGKVLFLAKAPSVGYAVYDVQAADTAPAGSTLKVSESSLENARYVLKLDQNGDVSSIYDKSIKRELLSAAARLAIKTDKPVDWPAWNMDYADQQKPPRAFVSGPATVRVVENGPVRVAVEVTRETEGSKFVQTVRLSAGDAGNRVEFANAIDWKTAEANLKATFPLTASSPLATYNWDIGTIQRANNEPNKFEVASHQWFDLTDKTGTFGVTVLSDAKNASDKPDDNTLRLTLIRTPGLGTGNGRSYADQTSQDWGHHEFVYGIAAHAGDWRQEKTDWQALCLNQPLLAFATTPHSGSLGKSFSLVNVGNPRVRVMALKKAEQSDEIVVRLVEVDGKPQQNVRIAFAAPITGAREINGAEEPVGEAPIFKGELITNFSAYQPRTFAVTLAPVSVKLIAQASQPVALAYDRSVATPDGKPGAGAFDSQGRAIAAEMLPRELEYDGIRFSLAPAGDYKANAVTARGQTITLPEGKYNRLYVLAAADNDQRGTFRVGDKTVEVTVQSWSGYIGQWDNRIWKQVPAPPPTPEEQARIEERRRQQEAARRAAGDTTPLPPIRPQLRMIDVFDGLTPGYVKTSPVAWFASHRHNSDGANEAYAYSYLFAYVLDVPAGARTLTLPNNDRIRILAVTAADAAGEARPVQPLFDTLERQTATVQPTAAAR
jgi:alpha-mannosidase